MSTQGPHRGGGNRDSLRKKRNLRGRPSQYAQRAGSARELLQCVVALCTNSSYVTAFVFRYYWRKSPVSQKSSILPRRYGLLPAFRHFRHNFTSFFICFIRIRTRIDRPHSYHWKFSVKLIRLDAVAPKISGLTSQRDFSSRKDRNLLLSTSKYPLR